MDEDALIAWLRRRAAHQGGERLGDDAAILDQGWAVTTDTQIESVHFPPGLDPAIVARRLLAVNLSDLAAMGAVPATVFLVLAAPPGFDHRRFLRAILAAAKRYGVELAGGDLARHERLTAVLTAIGTKPPDGRWLRRGAARPGDRLWLGGRTGESALGRLLVAGGATLENRKVVFSTARTIPEALGGAARRAVRRHLDPRPQLELGRWLGRRARAAALDVSDGLARDLDRLCRESRVGAAVDAERLAPSAAMGELARWLSADAERLALSGGEDYVLLFALPADEKPPERFRCREIGSIERGSRLTLRRGGASEILTSAGWDHLADPSD